jgi:hypothetical protein
MNPSIQKVKAGGSRVRSQPALHSNTLSQKKQANKQTKKKKQKQNQDREIGFLWRKSIPGS